MAIENFRPALNTVLGSEGGKVDHPKDPGGRTNRGVTQRVYDGFRDRRKLARKDVWEASESEIAEIYRRQYWDKVRGDALPIGVDYAVFDGAVNSGPVQAVKWLQRVIGVKVDGVIGEATLAAVAAYPDHDELIARMLERRLAFLQALGTWKTFGKGWSNRITHVRKVAQGWARGSVGALPVYFAGGEAKGLLEDARKVPGKGIADATSGGGVVAATITQVTDALLPVSDALPSIATVVTVLTAVGAVATVGGILYRAWASRKEAELADALDLRPRAPEPVAVAATVVAEAA